jgi:hypothetical protein
MEAEDQLPCTHEPATGPYPKPDKSRPRPHNLISLGATLISSIILKSKRRFFNWTNSLGFSY